MIYKELQKTAKELGLPFIGIPKRELEESISRAQSPEKSPTPPVTPAETVVQEDVAKEVKAKSNTAIVYDGNREIRRYTLDQHGPKFADYALEFIEGRKYTIKFVDFKSQHICPACGHKYDDK